MSKDPLRGSKILLVEDEETLAVGLEYNLLEEGYSVVRAGDGKKALKIFQAQEFDLIILDIMLPFLDGFEVARKIREKSPKIPILMLTAKSSIDDRLHGLEIGADDYLTKPFHLQELILRVKGMLKRKRWYTRSTQTGSTYRFGDNEINFETLSYRTGAGEFRLTPHEAMVLKYLIDHRGKIVYRKELLEKVWGISSDIETRTVDNFILRFRKYFEPAPEKPIYFRSIRSAGYIFSD